MYVRAYVRVCFKIDWSTTNSARLDVVVNRELNRDYLYGKESAYSTSFQQTSDHSSDGTLIVRIVV